jgi:non-heme chloroperoxidase
MKTAFTTRDGTEIHYKDWGSGRPVVLSHGWPLSADSWEAQMMFLAGQGFRVVAHDRRGHGRSAQPWRGNDMDTYADDLAELLEALALHDVALVGFSAGGGEVARYIGRHGTARVRQAVLVSAVPPRLLRTPSNPEGVPAEVFDGMRARARTDRAQLFRELGAGPFFGFNRPGAKVSEGAMDWFWLQGMQAGHKNTYDGIQAFSETDFTADLQRFDVPTLVVHGDDDQIAPLECTARRCAGLLPDARLLVYPGAPHGLIETHKDRFNADLLAFLQA